MTFVCLSTELSLDEIVKESSTFLSKGSVVRIEGGSWFCEQEQDSSTCERRTYSVLKRHITHPHAVLELLKEVHEECGFPCWSQEPVQISRYHLTHTQSVLEKVEGEGTLWRLWIPAPVPLKVLEFPVVQKVLQQLSVGLESIETMTNEMCGLSFSSDIPTVKTESWLKQTVRTPSSPKDQDGVSVTNGGVPLSKTVQMGSLCPPTNMPNRPIQHSKVHSPSQMNSPCNKNRILQRSKQVYDFVDE